MRRFGKLANFRELARPHAKTSAQLRSGRKNKYTCRVTCALPLFVQRRWPHQKANPWPRCSQYEITRLASIEIERCAGSVCTKQDSMRSGTPCMARVALLGSDRYKHLKVLLVKAFEGLRRLQRILASVECHTRNAARHYTWLRLRKRPQTRQFSVMIEACPKAALEARLEITRDLPTLISSDFANRRRIANCPEKGSLPSDLLKIPPKPKMVWVSGVRKKDHCLQISCKIQPKPKKIWVSGVRRRDHCLQISCDSFK